MSLIVLKRKSKTLYNNQSVGVPAFSINGTRRGMSYIGQSTQSRHLVRKYIRDAGHGGCCGTYLDKYQSAGMCNLNDSSVVKSSSMSSSVLASKRMREIKPEVKKYLFESKCRLDKLKINAIVDTTNNVEEATISHICRSELHPLFQRSYTNIAYPSSKKLSCSTIKILENPYENKLLKIQQDCMKINCTIGNFYRSSIMRAPLPGNTKL